MSLSNIDSKTAVMAIFGSLLAFMFYGRIQDASDIVMLKEKVAQGESERRDWWTKWNEQIAKDMANFEKMANFMIEDARQKEALKEEILKLDLKIAERELEQIIKE